jgi:RNA polymerase sigma factor (sigma-70 family)
MVPKSDELIQTRTTLINRLKNWQDHSSWKEFFDTYWKLIYGISRKTGLSDAEAQDVVQETMISVSKHMPTFKYDRGNGSFKAWLLNLTRWRVMDQLRKRENWTEYLEASSLFDVGSAETQREIVDPAGLELDKFWDDEWKLALMEAAISKVKRRLDPQKYQIYDFYVNKEWPATKVAGKFGISLDQVYVAKYRIINLIVEEVKRLNQEMT